MKPQLPQPMPGDPEVPDEFEEDAKEKKRKKANYLHSITLLSHTEGRSLASRPTRTTPISRLRSLKKILTRSR